MKWHYPLCKHLKAHFNDKVSFRPRNPLRSSRVKPISSELCIQFQTLAKPRLYSVWKCGHESVKRLDWLVSLAHLNYTALVRKTSNRWRCRQSYNYLSHQTQLIIYLCLECAGRKAFIIVTVYVNLSMLILKAGKLFYQVLRNSFVPSLLVTLLFVFMCLLQPLSKVA